MIQKCNLTVKELEKLTKYWKHNLGLQDWRIGVKIERQNKLQLEDVAGENEYIHQCKTALISILDFDDYGDRIYPCDQEKTLVHELLHCVFSTIDTDDVVRDRVQHQIIESIAQSLVNAKRDGMRGGG